MSLTFDTANAVLKEDYKDPLREQLNQATFILSQIEQNTDDVVGKRAYLAIHVGRSSGVGARAENETLPPAASQQYEDVNIPIRYNYGRIQVSGPIIRAMSKDRGSFIRAVKSETDGITIDLKRDVNRQIWGDSTGAIAEFGVNGVATNVLDLAATTTSVQLKQLFAEGGMVIDIGTVATPTSVATQRTVIAIDDTVSPPTVEIDGAAITTAGGEFAFRFGAGGESSHSGLVNDGQRELTGLQNIVNDDDLYNIDPSLVPTWAALTNDNGGVKRTISESLVNKLIQDTEIRSGKQVDLLIGTPGVTRSVAASLESIRRNIDNVDLEAGWSGIAWSTPLEGMQGAKTRALCWDQDTPGCSLYGICTESLVEFVMSDWDWMDEDGAVLNRRPDIDAYEATLFKYHEVGVDQRNANFKIVDITEA